MLFLTAQQKSATCLKTLRSSFVILGLITHQSPQLLKYKYLLWMAASGPSAVPLGRQRGDSQDAQDYQKQGGAIRHAHTDAPGVQRGRARRRWCDSELVVPEVGADNRDPVLGDIQDRN